MESVIDELRADWVPRVDECLLRLPGAFVKIDRIAKSCPLPPNAKQRRVRFKRALIKCGFDVRADDTVRVPGREVPVREARRRRREEDGDDEFGRQVRRRVDRPPSPEEVERRIERDARFGIGDDRYAPRAFEAGPEAVRGAVNWSVFDATWTPIEPQTPAQREYYDVLRDESAHVVVALGATGSGKTLLAVQEGLRQLREGRVRRLILTRPNVLAGEDIGFLPGDANLKLQPLLAPALDAVNKVLGRGVGWMKLQRARVLEFQAFAFMRGRTHDGAFIISDEAQNNSLRQLQLLVTRFGEGSKLCVLGDPAQPDRSTGNWVGGGSALDLLAQKIENPANERERADVENYSCVRFGPADCRRHPTAKVAIGIFDSIESEQALARPRGRAAIGGQGPGGGSEGVAQPAGVSQFGAAMQGIGLRA